MDAERLFLATMGDLDRRLDGTDEYETLMIAPLLRKLLLDGQPLVHQVNARYRHRICFRYTTNGYRKLVLEMKPSFWAMEDGLDPETHHTKSAIADGGLDQFLKIIVIAVGNESYTIHQVIDLICHVEGGVHAGTSRDARQAALKAVERSISVGSLPPAVRSLLAIGRVVRRGLEPLRASVAANFAD